MPDPKASHENVRFDWEAARGLAMSLRSTANALLEQVPRRTAIAKQARQEWRGVFAEEFDGRMKTCTDDATRLAAAMQTAAQDLDTLANAAQEQQDRIEKAREWERKHDDWERKQEHRSVVEKGTDFFGLTDDDEEPLLPKTPKITPPRFTSESPIPRGPRK